MSASELNFYEGQASGYKQENNLLYFENNPFQDQQIFLFFTCNMRHQAYFIQPFPGVTTTPMF